MKFSTSAAVAVALVVGLATSAVIAQQNPIQARQQLMKDTGRATAALSRMVKGDAPFDLAAAQASFKTYQDVAATMPTLFPADSKTGDTTAGPAIWEKNDDFKARFVKFGNDAKAAAGSVKDLDTLKAAMGTIAPNCGGCHEAYRVKKG